MRILVVLGHPGPGSFNHAIAERAVQALRANGHEIFFHDLYAEGFAALMPAEELGRDADLSPEIARHCRELADAEGIVIVHPNWWGQPPAILKGWVDRVFRPGIAYAFAEDDSGAGVPAGLLKARRAVVLNTSDTAKEREREVFGDPLESLWSRCILGYCGVTEIRRKNYGVVVNSLPEEREAWLRDTEETVDRAFPASS